MEKKQSSIEQIFSHIKASRNDIQYWNDSMLVDWLLEQEDRLKEMHKEEIKDAISVGYNMATPSEPYDNLHKGDKYYIEAYGGDDE